MPRRRMAHAQAPLNTEIDRETGWLIVGGHVSIYDVRASLRIVTPRLWERACAQTGVVPVLLAGQPGKWLPLADALHMVAAAQREKPP